jgi:hypothetical protein
MSWLRNAISGVIQITRTGRDGNLGNRKAGGKTNHIVFNYISRLAGNFSGVRIIGKIYGAHCAAETVAALAHIWGKCGTVQSNSIGILGKRKGIKKQYGK